MSDIDLWVAQCRAALFEAERLSAQLHRLSGADNLRLASLRLRITDLRAAIETLAALQADAEAPEPGRIHPDWMRLGERSPWCSPES